MLSFQQNDRMWALSWTLSDLLLSTLIW
jgi:hypothetical protein